ncbi:MAG: hypothetical protein C4529_08905 [Deltaproteobacteria bacterium]|nr:MAG: hypothetical protein C4529_08905 [Deltaproteobacteria bacterium]
MAKFIVKSPLKFDGKRYEPGKTVDIDDKRTDVVEPLLSAGIIEPKKAAKGAGGDGQGDGNA